MTEDMAIANLAPRTQECYIERVAEFAAYHGRCPSKVGLEGVRAFQAHLAHERGVSTSYIVQATAALRFLYRVTLGRGRVAEQIRFPKRTESRLSGMPMTVWHTARQRPRPVRSWTPSPSGWRQSVSS
jgi:hypothetical protein